MLDANLKTQLKAYLERLQKPLELVATLDDSKAAGEVKSLLADIAALSDKITVVENNDLNVRKPSFAINNPGVETGVRFAGVPLGHEFTSLVLALLHVGGHPSKESADLLEQVKAIDAPPAFRDLLLAVLPQLPRCGAGAEPDVGPETPTSPTPRSTAACSRTKSRTAKSWACPPCS